MRYTVEDIEKMGDQVVTYRINQEHLYSVKYDAFIPKGREVVHIYYEDGDHESEPGLIILVLDNGAKVEASFDIDMLRDHLCFLRLLLVSGLFLRLDWWLVLLVPSCPRGL